MKILKKDQINILDTLLSLLNIKHTKVYTEHILDNNPYGHSLYAFSNMLAVYNVDSVAVDVKDKENDIRELELPFVAHTGSNYALVTEISEDTVYYVCHRKPISLPMKDFLEMWNGITLLVKANKNSIEPGYKENLQLDTLNKGQDILFAVAVIILCGIGYCENRFFESLPHNILLLVNLAGLYISYLLILKQLHIHSSSADKICSAIKKGNCDEVLNSAGAKLFGILGCSEVGLGYFLANLLIILFLPSLFPYLVIINVCAVTYSFWSVGYQVFKIKFFCPLCLTIQAIFWITFFLEFGFRMVHIPELSLLPIVETLCIFAVLILGVNIIVPKMFQDNK